VTKSTAFIGSLVVASLAGAAVFLRPHSSAREELAEPVAIPSAMLTILKAKMGRHDLQMKALMTRVVLLDDDGVARAAGAIYDEPSLARPVVGDELNGLLPERFFVLQDELRARARRLVIASSHHDRATVADEFAALSKTCVTCHDVYLRGAAIATPGLGGAP
jgi:hypothetical protein